jgi:hypothetical protein
MRNAEANRQARRDRERERDRQTENESQEKMNRCKRNEQEDGEQDNGRGQVREKKWRKRIGTFLIYFSTWTLKNKSLSIEHCYLPSIIVHVVFSTIKSFFRCSPSISSYCSSTLTWKTMSLGNRFQHCLTIKRRQRWRISSAYRQGMVTLSFVCWHVTYLIVNDTHCLNVQSVSRIHKQIVETVNIDNICSRLELWVDWQQIFIVLLSGMKRRGMSFADISHRVHYPMLFRHQFFSHGNLISIIALTWIHEIKSDFDAHAKSNPFSSSITAKDIVFDWPTIANYLRHLSIVKQLKFSVWRTVFGVDIHFSSISTQDYLG